MLSDSLYLGLFLPDNLRVFEIGGQSVFPRYTADGGLSSSAVVYLWEPSSNKVLGVSVPVIGNKPITNVLGDAVKAFAEKAVIVNVDGGQMPEPIDFSYRA